MKLSLSIIGLCLFFISALAQNGHMAKDVAISRIGAYCTGVDRIAQNHSSTRRVFANVSDSPQSKWREFPNEKARQRVAASDNVNESAYVWTKGGKIVGVNFTFQSGSRDWVQYVMYYFRPDGTLAKIDARLNTFYGNISVLRQIYYDEQGMLLKKVVDYRELGTEHRKAPSEDFIDEEIPIYRQVAALPFHHLLGAAQHNNLFKRTALQHVFWSQSFVAAA